MHVILVVFFSGISRWNDVPVKFLTILSLLAKIVRIGFVVKVVLKHRKKWMGQEGICIAFTLFIFITNVFLSFL
jgi:hypothetical protein